MDDILRAWLAQHPIDWEKVREERAKLVEAGILLKDGGLGPNHWLVKKERDK